jgi:hypothetical protein
MANGVTWRSDVSSTGGQNIGFYARYPVVSFDSHNVTFEAKAYGLVNPEPPNLYQVYGRYDPVSAAVAELAGQLLGGAGGADAMCLPCIGGSVVGLMREPVNLENSGRPVGGVSPGQGPFRS